MTRGILIKKMLDSLAKLPDQRIKEVSDFVEFLAAKIDDQLITEGIQQLAADSKSFSFLEEEEVVYTKADLKEIYK